MHCIVSILLGQDCHHSTNTTETECTQKSPDVLVLYNRETIISDEGILYNMLINPFHIVLFMNVFVATLHTCKLQGHVIKDCCPDKTVGAIKEVCLMSIHVGLSE